MLRQLVLLVGGFMGTPNLQRLSADAHRWFHFDDSKHVGDVSRNRRPKLPNPPGKLESVSFVWGTLWFWCSLGFPNDSLMAPSSCMELGRGTCG